MQFDDTLLSCHNLNYLFLNESSDVRYICSNLRDHSTKINFNPLIYNQLSQNERFLPKTTTNANYDNNYYHSEEICHSEARGISSSIVIGFAESSISEERGISTSKKRSPCT